MSYSNNISPQQKQSSSHKQFFIKTSPLKKINSNQTKTKHSRTNGSVVNQFNYEQQTNPQRKLKFFQLRKSENFKQKTKQQNVKNQIKSKKILLLNNGQNINTKSLNKFNINTNYNTNQKIRNRKLSNNDLTTISRKHIQNLIIQVQEQEQILHIRDRKFSQQINNLTPSFHKWQINNKQKQQNKKENQIQKNNNKLTFSKVQRKNQPFNQKLFLSAVSHTNLNSLKTIQMNKKTFSFMKQIKQVKNKNNNASEIQINYIQKSQSSKLIAIPSFLSKKNKHLNQRIESQYFKKKQTKNELHIKDFLILKELGEGKFGKVFLVKQRRTNFICAMKILKKQDIILDNFIQQFIRQIKIQSFLNHPNIIKMYGYFDDLSNIYVLIQLACDGTLFKYFNEQKKLSNQINTDIKLNNKQKKGIQGLISSNEMNINEISNLIGQIGEGVKYLHNLNIIHRDLKPQNIVIHQKQIKICDFGWSIYKGQTMRNTFCGTPLYLCPQLVIGQQYDQKVDIWALGIMLYQIKIGPNPFNINKQQDLSNIVYNDLQKNISQSNLQNQIKQIIKGCLNKNPSNRFNIKQFINHQFFKKYCPELNLNYSCLNNGNNR